MTISNSEIPNPDNPMNWQLLPQFAITGLLNGGPIALIALGIVLIFKSSEIFNFAQGQMLLIGAMATWWFATRDDGLGLPLVGWPSSALVVSVLLGLLIERLALRPMTGQPLLAIILMTLALAQFLQGLTILSLAPQRSFPVIFSITDPYQHHPALHLQRQSHRRHPEAKSGLVLCGGHDLRDIALVLFFQYTTHRPGHARHRRKSRNGAKRGHSHQSGVWPLLGHLPASSRPLAASSSPPPAAWT
jgi:hypothetical protein